MKYTDPRLYVPLSCGALREGAEVFLLPQQAHYLGNVMRRKVGQTVRVFNGHDGEWCAKLIFIKRTEAVISLLHKVRPQKETRSLNLIFALLKREATELVIRMGTELGVTHFYPVITARTNQHRLNESRLTLIAQEASEQCERLDVPVIDDVQTLHSCLSEWPENILLAVALERQSERQEEETAIPQAAGLVVGPEGGFTEEEMTFLRKHRATTGISLGPRILRAETAVCAGLALLNVH